VPMIAKGRVVYAPSDGNAVLCISMRDGSLIWKNPRKETDVLLAGVVGDHVVVVGKQNCRAINLEDGKEAWSLETGRPSGLGVAVGGQFYLPLAKAQGSGEPEICVIDVAKGNVAARVRSRKKEVPGNLMFHDGVMISQTATTITAYPLLENHLKTIDNLLKKNEKDPEALARRGDLKLDKGDFKGAVEDFLAARKNEPPKELQPRITQQLYDAMVELFGKDFDAALPHLKTFEELSKDVPKGQDAERARRRLRFLILVGRGFESQRKPVEATRYYLDLIDLDTKGELLEVPGEPGLKVSPTVHARRQLEKILDSAKGDDRKKIEQEILERIKKARSDGQSRSEPR
jgi:hypothetical protein